AHLAVPRVRVGYRIAGIGLEIERDPLIGDERLAACDRLSLRGGAHFRVKAGRRLAKLRLPVEIDGRVAYVRLDVGRIAVLVVAVQEWKLVLIHRGDDQLLPWARCLERADDGELDAWIAAARSAKHGGDERLVEALLPLHAERAVRTERARQPEVPVGHAAPLLDVEAQAERIDDRLFVGVAGRRV